MADGSASILTSVAELDPLLDLDDWIQEPMADPKPVNQANDIPCSGINGGPIESGNEQTQVEPCQTNMGGSKSELSPARGKRKIKRKADKKSRDRILEKLNSVHGLLPSRGKAKKKLTKATKLDNIKDYVLFLQKENKRLRLGSTIQEVPSTVEAFNIEILEKMEADVESQVKFSDFNLDGESIMVGKYSFPSSLCPIVNKINDVYGDVSAKSKFNHHSNEVIYVMLCAIIKEMDELLIHEVTEDRILKWRDVIKDALRMDFDVDFAMQHLKMIARACIGLKERQKLDTMNTRISNLEDQLKTEKDESKIFVDAADYFIDKPVSSGIF